MKTLLAGLLVIMVAGWSIPTPASIYYQGTVTDPGGSGTAAGSLVNSAILDGNTAGMFNSMNLSGAGMANSLVSVTVTVNVSGGNIGDLYAYLSYNGVLVPLINRIGLSSGNQFGSTGAGLNNVTLSDIASQNIHQAGNGPLSNSYRADGENIDPLSSAASFNSAGGTITLNGAFGGMNPNGSWGLYFADVVAGGGNETLVGWSLDITSVPEPITIALPIFGVALGAARLIRRFPRRQTAFPLGFHHCSSK